MNIELLKTITILYVEDELSLQDEVSQNISPFVKKFIVTSDGLEGLSFFKNHQDKIDVVMTDILMPNMNGMDMVDKIRELDADIPIIYVTAFNDAEYLQRMVSQFIVGCVLKPIDIEFMLQKIEKASIMIENERLKIALIEHNKNLKEQIRLKTQELEDKNTKLYYQLYTDRMTSLLNRNAFFRDVEIYKKPILFIADIDRFKNINDLYGEHIGNLVISAVSKLFKKFARKNGYELHKMGSDIFALIKNDDDEDIDAVAKEIIELINANPLEILDYDIYIKINITIGISTQDVNLFESADMALKKAKKDRVSYLLYKDEYNMQSEYQEDLKWTKIIENAVENDKLKAYYQPIVDRNQNIVKYEALVRLIDGDNVYTPDKFLDISKQIKVYSQLTKTMLKQAFEAARSRGVKVNVNLSIEDILSDDIIKYIKDLLNESGVCSLVTFEILETENIINYDSVIEFIDTIKKLGCNIAIDDFGSGYSNFVYLIKLQPDVIKIDGSIVRDIDTDKNSLLIVKTINEFAHEMGMQTVAEFVHSKEVFEILKDLGVDYYQGYYFSEPLAEI